MCGSLFKTPKAKDPVMPPQYAAQKAPALQSAKPAGQLVRNRMKNTMGTVLTGAFGTGPADLAGKKVLTGQ